VQRAEYTILDSQLSKLNNKQILYCATLPQLTQVVTMSEEHFDEFEHYNYDQDKAMHSGHSGKQRSKKEASMNTNQHNPAGHERKIATKLMNAEKNSKASASNASSKT